MPHSAPPPNPEPAPAVPPRPVLRTRYRTAVARPQRELPPWSTARASARRAVAHAPRVDGAAPTRRGVGPGRVAVAVDGTGTNDWVCAQLRGALGAAYVLERELGGGGMSRVFVAEETALGRRVAIKVLAPDLSGALDAERFRREVQIAARLQHPHIVPVLAAGEAAGMLYYTMPFVEGESLRARLSRSGPLSIVELVYVVRDVAKALACAHRRGIVHRDIKPENVLVDLGGDALVADFGISKALSVSTTGTHTAAGLVLGTPAYIAPEQAACDPATDHRADLYALGVLTYELLAGVHPFAGRAPQAVIAAHIVEAPAPVTQHRPDAPPQLAALVMRLLEKRPADRPQSADEVLRALDALAAPPPRVAAVVLAEPHHRWQGWLTTATHAASTLTHRTLRTAPLDAASSPALLRGADAPCHTPSRRVQVLVESLTAYVTRRTGKH